VSFLDYWAILRRRWVLIAVIVLLDLLLSGFTYRRANQSAGYQSCLTVYVADLSAPSIVAASSSLENAAELLAGESAANFFADDLLDVAQSRSVARYVSRRIASKNLPDSSFGSINGSVGGARQDRTVNLCLTNPSRATAAAAAGALGTAMTSARAQFVGNKMASRTFVKLISPPNTAPAPKSKKLLTLALQLILGLLVALGLALMWDALDPRVRDRADLERSLGLPVLASS
jgi:capsular polysaccharide biosynthesis protein